MKTLIISFLLVLSAAIGQAQDVTVLDEARVGFAPLNTDISADGDSFTFTVNESYTGEFVKNPIAFMKANFDIQNYIAEVGDENFDTYLVTFRSSNGFLRADFNEDGDLVKTQQNFKNILLPLDIRREVYNGAKGWTMVQNKYIASGRGDLVEKEIYRVKLQKGSRKQNVKIDGRNLGIASVASN